MNEILSSWLPRGSRRRALLKSLLFRAPRRLARRHRPLTAAGSERVREALLKHYFSRFGPAYLQTPEGGLDLEAHLGERLANTRHRVVPWLDAARPLEGARILEIGCGTGSSTVALAEQGAHVTAVDIEAKDLVVAEERCRAHGVAAELVLANAIEAHTRFQGRDFDLLIFYASLEHMTIAERLEAVRTTWGMLRPGSLWSVIETPNRLWFYDGHSAQMPFFHWLPDELAVPYARFSPRAACQSLGAPGQEADPVRLARFGRGMSFHEFHLALPGLKREDVVSDLASFSRRNPLIWLAWRLSRYYSYERLLARLAPEIHPGFFAEYLDLVLRKPALG